MKYLMKRRSVERIADTTESYEKLVKLGYVIKKDLEKENAADTSEEDICKEGAKPVEPDTKTADKAEAEEPDKAEAEKPKKAKSGKKDTKQEAV